MNVILALLGLVALLAIVVHLARLVVRDGYGTTPPPRSHVEELDYWSTQQMRR